MPALARITEIDYDTHAENDDCINGGPGTRTKFTYDGLGHLVRVVDTHGGATRHTMPPHSGEHGRVEWANDFCKQTP